MMTAWIDLIGMYNYDSHILDGLVYPEGLDGDILKDNILMESAEQELIYSNIDFMRKAIESWSKKQLHVWTELYDTTQYVYNPIWNKDGKFSETITRDLKGTEDYTDTHSVFGFNSSTEAPANKSVTDQDTSDSGTDTVNHTGTFKKDRDTTDTGTIKTERTEQGNIGVTSTQSMIMEQREVVQLNLYDVITRDFIDRFCLKVY